MHAIVLSGGVPEPDDPLYKYTQGMPKALVDICGKPMIQWVLDAMEGAEMVDQIIIIGLPSDSSFRGSKIVAVLPAENDLLENARAGVIKITELHPDARHVLISSSDIPAITPEIINWVVKTAMQTDDDIYYNVITRQVMEARFPDSNRSYTRLQDLELCGGDMNVVRTMPVTQNDELMRKVLAARKNSFKQAALIGFDTLFLLLIRRIDLDGAVRRVTKRLDITGRAIVCPYAEVGMDVDKPHQLEIMRADLAQRIAV